MPIIAKSSILSPEDVKRAVSIFFVCMAQMALLTHALVPHHYHAEIYTVVERVLSGDARGVLSHTHDHDAPLGEKRSDQCDFNETVASSVFRLRKDHTEDLPVILPLLPAVAATPLSLPAPDDVFLFALSHDVQCFTVRASIASFGLRAPPCG